MSQPEQRFDYFYRHIEQVLEDLKVDLDQGLSDEEARPRLHRYGPNRLFEAETRSGWQIRH